MMSLFLANKTPINDSLSMILIFVAVIAIMYFLMIRPEKKKQKKVEAMRDALKVGDNITTIGGIVGDVVSIKDGKDGKIVIETSADRVRMELEKLARLHEQHRHSSCQKSRHREQKSSRRAEKGEEKQVKLALTRKMQSILRVNFLFGCYLKPLCPPCGLCQAAGEEVRQCR